MPNSLIKNNQPAFITYVQYCTILSSKENKSRYTKYFFIFLSFFPFRLNICGLEALRNTVVVRQQCFPFMKHIMICFVFSPIFNELLVVKRKYSCFTIFWTHFRPQLYSSSLTYLKCVAYLSDCGHTSYSQLPNHIWWREEGETYTVQLYNKRMIRRDKLTKYNRLP